MFHCSFQFRQFISHKPYGTRMYNLWVSGVWSVPVLCWSIFGCVSIKAKIKISSLSSLPSPLKNDPTLAALPSLILSAVYHWLDSGWTLQPVFQETLHSKTCLGPRLTFNYGSDSWLLCYYCQLYFPPMDQTNGCFLHTILLPPSSSTSGTSPL